MIPAQIDPAPGFRSVIFAKDQPEFIPLPALVSESENRVVCEWTLDEEEVDRLMVGGRIRLELLGSIDEKGRLTTPMKLEVVR